MAIAPSNRNNGSAALEAFLRASSADQIRFIESLPIPELKKLNKSYIAWAEVHRDGPLDVNVWAWMLELIEPDQYNPHAACAADDGLASARERMTPAALKRIREQTRESVVRAILNATPEDQDKMLQPPKPTSKEDEPIPLIEWLRDWAQMIDYYARHFGRSNRCRELETIIQERIKHERRTRPVPSNDQPGDAA